MTVLIVVFAFSSLLGNYAYAEINLTFLRASKRATNVFRVVVLGAVALGSILALTAVWEFADVAMGLMAIVNLTAIVLLAPWAVGALRDYEAARKAGRDPVFRADDNPHLPKPLDTDVW